MGRKVTDGTDPNIWQLAGAQIPHLVRWIGGALLAGLTILCGAVFRIHTKRVDRLEEHIHARMDREMALLHGRLDETNRLLMMIANNTGSQQNE